MVRYFSSFTPFLLTYQIAEDCYLFMLKEQRLSGG